MASQEWSEPLLPIGQIHPSDEQAIRLILPIMTSSESQLICSLAAVLAFSASSCREGPATAETERTATAQGVDPDALAVPQQGVRHNGREGSVRVREDNRASIAQVRVGRAMGDRWLILDGVKPGDRIIVEGFQKFGSGDVVSPRLWSEGGSAEPDRPLSTDVNLSGSTR